MLNTFAGTPAVAIVLLLFLRSIIMLRFGPLAPRGVGSALQSGSSSLFHESWTASGTSADGSRSAFGEYNIMPPTNGKAYFHFLLDASASTWDRCSTGERKRVYESLLENFAKLILYNPDVVHPHDEIVVWMFNKRMQHLCSVQQKDFHTQLDFIREKYRIELDDKENYSATRLYDAVGVAMDKIRETWEMNKTADFFLVPFTDGKDYTSTMSLEKMRRKITELNARLHTFFITANLPNDCDLYKMLETQREMSLIELENTEPREIRRGFTILRDLIKAILVVVTEDRGELRMTRIVDYAETRREAGEHMMAALAERMRDSSLLEGWNSLQSLTWKP